MTTREAIQIAKRHCQAGELREAESLCRRVLGAEPRNAEALHVLGVVARNSGNRDLAVDLLTQAVRLQPDPAICLTLGATLHHFRRYAEAVEAFQLALSRRPAFADALNHLGSSLAALGRVPEAITAFRQALVFMPLHADVHNNLGSLLAHQGDRESAMVCYRAALAANPRHADAHYNLGNTHREFGDFSAAADCYRRAIACDPARALFHNNLGVTLQDLGQFAEAIGALQKAIALAPDSPDSWLNLANTHLANGDFNAAEQSCREAMTRDPEMPEAHSTLANIRGKRREFERAIECALEAIRLRPNFPEAYVNLGSFYSDLGDFQAAAAAYRKALELRPAFAEAHYNLGIAHRDLKETDAAIAAYEQALKLNPEMADAHNNLATEYKNRGEIQKAVAAFRASLALNPANDAYRSNLVYTLQFDTERAPGELEREAREWNERHCAPRRAARCRTANNRNPERRLRVGYVSSDFYAHSISFFIVPLLEHHDRTQVEVFCYAGGSRCDIITERIRSACDQWRDVRGLPGDRAAAMVHADEIDILIDLSMHSMGGNLAIFTYRPAPVQAEWLAYPGITGLETIDYRITDAIMDPKPTSGGSESERPLVLEGAWCCFEPVANFPAISPLPALATGKVTFGSLNNFCKVNMKTLACWARILAAVPESRLRLLSPAGETRRTILRYFAQSGVADRVDFFTQTAWGGYVENIASIDIHLDTFPCNGITVSCHALWLGVPVVSLTGREPVERAGLSLLSVIGLSDLAASSEDEYVKIAVGLANDLPRLANLRATMRDRMRASPLMDAPRFARQMENAYRSMWRTWCESPQP